MFIADEDLSLRIMIWSFSILGALWVKSSKKKTVKKDSNFATNLVRELYFALHTFGRTMIGLK